MRLLEGIQLNCLFCLLYMLYLLRAYLIGNDVNGVFFRGKYSIHGCDTGYRRQGGRKDLVIFSTIMKISKEVLESAFAISRLDSQGLTCVFKNVYTPGYYSMGMYPISLTNLIQLVKI